MQEGNIFFEKFRDTIAEACEIMEHHIEIKCNDGKACQKNIDEINAFAEDFSKEERKEINKIMRRAMQFYTDIVKYETIVQARIEISKFGLAYCQEHKW